MSRFNLILLAVIGVLVAGLLGSTMGKVSALEKRVDRLELAGRWDGVTQYPPNGIPHPLKWPSDSEAKAMLDEPLRNGPCKGMKVRDAEPGCVHLSFPKSRWVSGAKMPGPIAEPPMMKDGKFNPDWCNQPHHHCFYSPSSPNAWATYGAARK